MSERWKRIEAILQEALARPPADRDAYVREACGSDHALCAEITSLLEQES